MSIYGLELIANELTILSTLSSTFLSLTNEILREDYIIPHYSGSILQNYALLLAIDLYVLIISFYLERL